jgi:hypothetical protein
VYAHTLSYAALLRGLIESNQSPAFLKYSAFDAYIAMHSINKKTVKRGGGQHAIQVMGSQSDKDSLLKVCLKVMEQVVESPEAVLKKAAFIMPKLHQED